MAMGMEPDFGRTAQDYAEHRAGFPESFFERLAARRIGVALLKERFPGDPIGVLHRVSAVIARALARGDS